MKPEITPEVLKQLWSNSANWQLGCIYYCHADPRVIVPKKWGIGWTMNFARASAVPVLVLVTVFIGAPLAVLARFGYVGTWAWWATIASAVVIVSIVCWYLASPNRFKK
ncbi:MAG: DUF5808 domain-containing protein [Limisphaerales bacterium]